MNKITRPTTVLGKMTPLLLIVLALLLLTAPVSAQNGPDYQRTPIFGSTSLQSGFHQQLVKVQVSTSVSISDYLDGDDCWGYTTSAPTYRVNLTGSGNYLRFFTMGSEDTTLVVNDPSGRWFCNDDSDGLNSQISFSSAPSGQYDIWVGSFTDTDINATLGVSGSRNYTRSSGLEHALSPQEFDFDLVSGFLPDPWTDSLRSGGNEYIPDAIRGSSCQGYTTDQPTYTMNWSGGGNYLRFYVDSDADTTMVINDPSGRWYCNDDFNGLDPQISFSNPSDGEYDIWIGSFQDQSHSATLNVSEFRGSNQNTGRITTMSALVQGTSSLRARSGPSINHPQVSSANGGVLFNGVSITLIGRAPQQSGSSIWVQLQGNTTRWVNSRFLSINGDIMDLPVTWNS